MDAEREVRKQTGELWVFGYGSLMWRPGFEFEEVRPALLRGYHRDLCIKSILYRGTPDQPGLVLGLDNGGSCRGMAYRIAAERRLAAVDYLDRRELATRAYHARFLQLDLDDGRRVTAYGYVCDHAHPQYAGNLPEEEKVALIRQGEGREGPCREYLANTVRHLDDLGIRDGLLHRMLRAVDEGAAGTRAKAESRA